jgi:hypothetical protein
VALRLLVSLTDSTRSQLETGIDYAKLKSQMIGIELLQAAPIRQTSPQHKRRSAPDISDLLMNEDGVFTR